MVLRVKVKSYTQSADVQLVVSGVQQPLFILEIRMFALSLVDFLYLLLSPSADIKIFLSKISSEGHIQNLQKFHVGLKFE